MRKPEWLRGLSALDRARAESWLKQVGEQRFLGIASAATAHQRRPRHRPRKSQVETDPLLRFAAQWWLTHPATDHGRAAGEAAAEVFPRRHAFARAAQIGTQQALRRLMSEGLKAMDADTLRDVAREAKQRGFTLRPEGDALLTTPDHPEVTAHIARLRKLARSIGIELDDEASPRAPLQPKSLQALLLSEPKHSPSMTAQQIDRVHRIAHVIAALKGVIDPKTPISRVVILLDDLTAAAKSTPTE